MKKTLLALLIGNGLALPIYAQVIELDSETTPPPTGKSNP